MEELLILRITC